MKVVDVVLRAIKNRHLRPIFFSDSDYDFLLSRNKGGGALDQFIIEQIRNPPMTETPPQKPKHPCKWNTNITPTSVASLSGVYGGCLAMGGRPCFFDFHNANKCDKFIPVRMGKK